MESTHGLHVVKRSSWQRWGIPSHQYLCNQIFHRQIFQGTRRHIFSLKHALVAGNVTVPYFLGGVIGGSPDTKFNVRGVVVKIVYFVVNTVVLTIGAGSPFRGDLKATMLSSIVVRTLRMPGK